jgi:hypothetical protein
VQRSVVRVNHAGSLRRCAPGQGARKHGSGTGLAEECGADGRGPARIYHVVQEEDRTGRHHATRSGRCSRSG